MKKNQIIFAVAIAAALNLSASEVEAAGSQFINDLKQEGRV